LWITEPPRLLEGKRTFFTPTPNVQLSVVHDGEASDFTITSSAAQVCIDILGVQGFEQQESNQGKVEFSGTDAQSLSVDLESKVSTSISVCRFFDRHQRSPCPAKK